MFRVLVSLTAFLLSYIFSAFQSIHPFVFRFQIDDKENELSSEMGDGSKKETGDSVLCSVSMETVSSLKMEDSVTCKREDLSEDSKEKNVNLLDDHGVTLSKERNLNVFDSLLEPEVQVLWEDYSIPSDSESEQGNSTNESPLENHEVDSSFKEVKGDIEVGESEKIVIANNLDEKEENFVDSLEKTTETKWEEKPSMLSFDYEYELNYLPDHQDIIQQLEMELGNARTGGLPTIFEEETETREAIDEKCKYEEGMGKIQKAYKAYAEKMWKLDVLNNQNMHAIGLLELKYPVQSISVEKSYLPQNPWLWSGKARNTAADPRLEFIGDLQNDMELVYIGQVCLSWEILQWQLRKALELQQHDSQGIRRYSQVVSELQLFQLLLKRFMEDEWFQGHRVENYVQNRCVFRSLLQVPAIKDDSFAEEKGREWEDDDDDYFSRELLAEIMEKSVCIFYEFLLTNKDDEKNILRSNRKHHIDQLHNSENSQLLLVNLQDHYQKVERKLKELLISSSNNGSLEKLEEKEESGMSYALILLIVHVDLKLISRVLRMSKLAVDQILWCNQKLNQITFVNRKVHLEPSLFLFPF